MRFDVFFFALPTSKGNHRCVEETQPFHMQKKVMLNYIRRQL